MRRPRAIGASIRTDALLLRKIPVNDQDVLVTFLTPGGTLACFAKSARASARRFGCLEPFHTLHLDGQERPPAPDGDLVHSLRGATVQRPRCADLSTSMLAMEAAGEALRWARAAAQPGLVCPELWGATVALLNDLDDPTVAHHPGALMAWYGLRLLADHGWGLDLTSCVSCGVVPGDEQSACVAPVVGGLRCQSCGGGRVVLGAERRRRLVRGADGDVEALQEQDGALVGSWVEAVLEANGRSVRGGKR